MTGFFGSAGLFRTSSLTTTITRNTTQHTKSPTTPPPNPIHEIIKNTTPPTPIIFDNHFPHLPQDAPKLFQNTYTNQCVQMYFNQLPKAKAVLADLFKTDKEMVEACDHAASRSWMFLGESSSIDIAHIIAFYESQGYKWMKNAVFELPGHILGTYFKDPNSGFRIFHSFIVLAHLSLFAQNIFKRVYKHAIEGKPLNEVIGLNFSRYITKEEYQKLLQESEYSGWLLTNGYLDFNHLTTGAKYTKYKTIEKLSAYLSSQYDWPESKPNNQLVQGTKESGLRQSALISPTTEVLMLKSDINLTIDTPPEKLLELFNNPNHLIEVAVKISFFELIERYEITYTKTLADGSHKTVTELYDSFFPESAHKIMQSSFHNTGNTTNTSAFKQTSLLLSNAPAGTQLKPSLTESIHKIYDFTGDGVCLEKLKNNSNCGIIGGTLITLSTDDLHFNPFSPDNITKLLEENFNFHPLPITNDNDPLSIEEIQFAQFDSDNRLTLKIIHLSDLPEKLQNLLQSILKSHFSSDTDLKDLWGKPLIAKLTESEIMSLIKAFNNPDYDNVLMFFIDTFLNLKNPTLATSLTDEHLKTAFRTMIKEQLPVDHTNGFKATINHHNPFLQLTNGDRFLLPRTNDKSILTLIAKKSKHILSKAPGTTFKPPLPIKPPPYSYPVSKFNLRRLPR